MVNLNDVGASELIKEAAKQLKGVISQPPDYIYFVKSGANKERVPQDPDFWYVRSASILRQVYVNGPVGVSRLRLRYGGRKGHTMHRGHSVKAGGSLIRHSLEALEAAQLVKKSAKGREITPKGKSFMDKASRQVLPQKSPAR